MSSDFLKTTMAYLDGVPFRVEDYPWEAAEEKGPEAFRKGVAYRYIRSITVGSSTLDTKLLLPYRGVIKMDDFSLADANVGIWYRRLSRDRYRQIIVRPRSAKEKEEYALSKERDLVAATLNHEISTDQLLDTSYNQADIGTDVYIPPMHMDDDPMNMLMKLGIRLKCAPFEPYGARMRALAVDSRKKGIEGSNIVNNNKRGLRLNRAMSPSKFMQFCDIWQLDSAIIIKDSPNAMHRMNIPEDKMLVIYPGGIPFDICQDDLIDASDMIAEAVASTTANEAHQKKKSAEKTENENEEDAEE